jgi:thioredoxin 1
MVQDQPTQNKPIQEKATQEVHVQGTPLHDKPIHITDDAFDKVVKENRYVVVDFWAEWCRPCHAIAPTIEELARKYAGKVVFAKINSDENQRKFQEYGVMGIPTLLFFKDGKLVDQVIGAMPKAQFEQRVVKHLG